jgi:opacity protein-like surface antigen
MRKSAIAVLVLGLAFSAGVREVSAQSVTFGVGGGVTIPTGDFNTAAKMGWHGIGQLGYGLSGGLGLRADFFYGENKFDGVSGKTKLAGGLGNISYDFQTAGGVKPYVIGGAGVFNVKASASAGGISASASETKFAFAAGGGLKFKAGSDSHVYVESRYVSVQTSGGSTGFIPVTVGISFGTK